MLPGNTPGVYIQEISTLPASIASVATAIPAFIGYTVKAEKNGDDLFPNAGANKPPVPIRITSMLEFLEVFGGAYPETFDVEVKDLYDNTTDKNLLSSTITAKLTATGYNLFYSLQMFFKNGGGACYIVSIGKADDPATIDNDHFEAGITALEKVDEPTLLLFPDATNLSQSDYGGVVAFALDHCAKLQDRFVIADGVDVTDSNRLDTTKLEAMRTAVGNNSLKYGAVYFPDLKSSINFGFDNSTIDITSHTGKALDDQAVTPATDFSAIANVNTIETDHPSVYRQILVEIKKHFVILPSSGAVAGIYARVDADRGVWKAPANVSISSVIGPSIRLTNADQDLLNIDAATGKSINAIRTFAGKGTLVWGARTLAGNDNEWKYVPVRRLYIFVEESIKKATEFVVFEPNDANTWVRTKSMIENFLTKLWREGGLAGAKPEDAFFVKVGLGETMTSDDILNGIMNIEIGMAAVRPAEFIILKFSHKLQE